MKNLNLLATLSFSLLISSQAFCQTGTLDPTFGTGGIVTTSYPGDNDGEAVAIQDDGKIVIVGTTDDPSGNLNLRAVRYLSDGTVDAGFGTSGTFVLSIASVGSSVAIQSDGKILVGGTGDLGLGNGSDAVVARLNTDGTLDNSFGTSGVVTTDFVGAENVLNGMMLQSDGKIVAGGTTDNNGDADFLLIRYNTDGTLDNTFGSGGTTSIDLNGDDQEGEFVLVQTDGKILIGGSSGDDAALMRFDATGSPDGSFGTGGFVTTDVTLGYNDALAGGIQSDGKIVIHGSAEVNIGPLSSENFSTIRYNSDGSLDQTFGSGGIVNTPVGNADQAAGTTMAIQSDGGIIVAGDAIVDTTSQFAMVRYLADGSIDPSFGSGGTVLTAIGPYEDLCNAMAIHPDNGQYIILVGESADVTSESDFALAQYQNTVGLFSLDLNENPLVVYPNPINDQSVIEYSLLQSESVSIGLYNLRGELIQTVLEETTQAQGDHHILLEVDGKLPHGNYLLKVETPSSVRSIEIHR